LKQSLRWEIAQWFELKWWKNYLKDKNTIEYLEYKRNYWKNLLEDISEINTNQNQKKILDIGCGPAGVYMIFNNHKVTAVDPLIERYEQSLDHFNQKKYPNVEFIPTTFETFQCKDKYDIIFCLNAINHFQDINRSLDKISDLLMPNGIYVESIDAHNYSVLKKIFKIISVDILHPHQYDIDDYKSMLSERSMTILKLVKIKKRVLFDYYLIVARKSN